MESPLLSRQGETNQSYVYSITNQKGGIGKTTTLINTVVYLAIKGKKILVIDADPQASSSSFLMNDYSERFEEADGGEILTLYATLVKRLPLQIHPSRYRNIDIVPNHLALASADLDLAGKTAREYILQRALDAVKNDYDYVFIDCPPNLGMLTINSFVASDRLLVIVEPGRFSLEGIVKLSATIEAVIKQDLKKNVDIRGFLLNKGNKPEKDLPTRKTMEELNRAFGDMVYKTFLPFRNAIATAQMENKTAFEIPDNDYSKAISYFVKEEFNL